MSYNGFQANLLHKVYNDVETEPSLQLINGEHINGLTGDESRPDIRARGSLEKWTERLF